MLYSSNLLVIIYYIYISYQVYECVICVTQGLDVLEIMRNIHVFVANYSYNLNNQVYHTFDTLRMDMCV